MAQRYDAGIVNPQIVLPKLRTKAESIYHQYVIRCTKRDALQAYLAKQDIQTQIHYPIPPHLAACYAHLGCHKGDYPIAEQYADQVLSLPIYTGMTGEEQQYVIDRLNAF